MKILDRAREKGFKTQKALAEAAGVTTETLRLISKGHLPSLNTIKKIAKALKEPPKKIVEWISPEEAT